MKKKPAHKNVRPPYHRIKTDRFRKPADVVKALVSEMYDKLAAKMVVALYREKRRILQELSR